MASKIAADWSGPRDYELMAQLNSSSKTYDVCIIGSGAGGGTAAKVLSEGGVNVVMLEAGPTLNPETDFKEHVWPYELPHRGAGVGGRARLSSTTSSWRPMASGRSKANPILPLPGSNFRWFRSRIVGGRTNHWGRIALRFARQISGPLHRWHGRRLAHLPMKKLAPYYDKVESFIGVFGTKGEYSRVLRMEFSCRRLRLGVRKPSSKRPATN